MSSASPAPSTVTATKNRSGEHRDLESVGHLAGEVCLAVHSYQALRLIWGRRRTAQKPPISGLIAFASAVNTIWQAADAGDPYALWWLLKVEQGIDQCRAHLQEQADEVGFLYPDSETLSVDTAESERPYRIRLTFSNPYAYRGAQMLGEYDALARTCYTLMFVGAGNPVDLRALVAMAGHRIRGVFAIPQRFKVCAITPEDIHQNNQRAQKAAQRMGPLPAEVLSGESSPVYVPAGARAGLGTPPSASGTASNGVSILPSHPLIKADDRPGDVEEVAAS